MKIRTYLLLLFITSGSAKVIAQDFYFKVGSGYAFAMPGGKLDQSGNALNGTITHGATSTKYNLKSASFSFGLHGTLTAGLMISKNIGVELNTDFMLDPMKYRATINGLTGTNSNTNSTYTYSYVAERQAKNMIILMPSLILQTAGACNLYMRMGLALPFNTGMKLRETYYYNTGQVNEYTSKMQNYFSLGIAAASGVKFKVGDHISVWGEISMLSLSLAREQEDLETVKLNGVSHPVSQLTGIKTVHFNKNGISDKYGNAQALPQPFSNIGVSLGLSYNLGNNKKK